MRWMVQPSLSPLAPMSMEEKAREAKRFWQAWENRRAYRVPISFSINAPMMVEGVDGIRYYSDPDYMMAIQLRGQRWIWEYVPQDQLEPEEWQVWPDFQNFYEAGWFGCPIRWLPGPLEKTRPMPLIQEKDRFHWDVPDPLKGNLMGRAYEFRKVMIDRARNMTFEGKKISVGAPTGTDGPFTQAYLIRGSDLLIDLYKDSTFVDKLMDYITRGIILRMKAWMDLVGIHYPADSFGFADDMIEALSPEQYRRFVLPHHKLLVRTFSKNKKPNSIHLCGRVQQHLRMIHEELNVGTFELGFPVDLGLARRELGRNVHLIGNVNPTVLLKGPVELIEMEVKGIFDSGVSVGGYNFTLREGNQVAPGTPLNHLCAFYNAGVKYGRYDERA